MRKLANFFLLMFLLAALTALADALQYRFFPTPVISEINLLVWLVCVVTGALVYLGSGFSRQLPKAVVAPLLLWILWRLIDYWPLKMVDSSAWLTLAGGQLLLSLVVFTLNRKRNHGHLLFTRQQFSGPAFSGRNFLNFILISILLIPFATLCFTFFLANYFVQVNTAGFVQLKPDGLYLAERNYRKGEKQVRLTAMIHLGRDTFYSDLLDSLVGGKTLILAEGVSDRKGLLQKNFSYGGIADLLGLAAQEEITFPGHHIESLEQAPTGTASKLPDILQADIDLSQFDPRTIAVINALAEYLLNAESLPEGYRQFNRWAQQHVDDDLNRIVMDDLIDKRNRAVINTLPAALEK